MKCISPERYEKGGDSGGRSRDTNINLDLSTIKYNWTQKKFGLIIA